jgi:hypothetical protein
MLLCGVANGVLAVNLEPLKHEANMNDTLKSSHGIEAGKCGQMRKL